MKRFLLFLTCVLTLFGVARAEEKTETWTASTNFATSKTALESKGWSINTSNGKYTGYEATKGMQFGSSSNSESTVTITSGSSCPFAGKTIKSVKVNASGASKVTCSLAVSVGSSNYGSNSLTNAATDYTYTSTSSASGNITIKFTQSTSVALYLNSIEVTYEEGSGTTDPDPGTDPNPNPGGDEFTLTGDSFTGFTTSYKVYTTTQNQFGNIFSAYAYKSGGLQINSSKKACGIIVSTVSPDYKIAAIDITFGTAKNGIDIYKKSTAFTASSTESTAISTSGATKLNSTAITTDQKNYKIDDFAFAIIPNGGNNVITSITVYYEAVKKVPVDYQLDSNIPEEMGVGGTYTINLGSPAPSNFKITANNAYASVTTSAPYEIKAISKGTAEFTATWDGDENYNAGSKNFSITITAPKTDLPKFEYSASTATWDLAEDAVNDQLPTLNFEPSDIDITYDSSDPTVATINSSGVVTIVGKGETTITASFAGDETYNKATSSYTLTIVAPVAPVPTTDDKFELVKKDSELVEGEYYVIAFNNSGTYYSMSSSESSSRIQGVKVNVKDNVLEPAETTLILRLCGSTGNWSWEVAGGEKDGKYVSWPNETKSSLENNALSTSVTFDGDDVKIQSNGTGNRYIKGYASSNDFRGYSSSDGIWPRLYRLAQPPKPKMPEVTLNEETLESGGSKIVEQNSILIISVENADDVKINDVSYPLTEGTYEYTLSDLGEKDLTICGTNENGYGEEFTYTFIVDTKVELPDGSNFKQMLNGSEITEGYYVIARVTDADNVAMKNEVGSNNVSGTTNFSVTSVENNGYVLTTTDNDVLIVKMEQKDGNIGIKSVNLGEGFNSEQGYLYAPDENATTLTFEKDFKPAFFNYPQGSNNINIYFEEGSNRRITKGNSTNNIYFNYQINNGYVQLYKFTEQKIFSPEFGDLKLRIGTEDTYPLSLPENAPEISYNIEGDCITIANNTITVVEPGEATVTATWNEDDTYFGGSVTFTVTVLPEMVQLDETNFFFRHATVRGKVGVGVLSQAVYYEGDGQVEYSIWEGEDGSLKSTSEIIINSQTGMIRPSGIVDAVIGKPYTVKASVASTDYYTEGLASYTIIIDAPDEASKGDKVENFADNNHWKDKNGNECKIGTSYEDDAYTIVSEDTGIEYTIYKGLYQNSLQLNKDKETLGYVEFTIPANCQTITIGKGNTTGNSTPKLTILINGEITETFDFDEDKTINVAESKGVMTIKNGIYDTAWEYVARISSLTFTIPTVDTPEAGLYFDVSDKDVNHYINAFVGEEIKLPTLNHNDALKFDDIDLDIDEIDEFDEDEAFQNYTFEGTTDFDNIRVTVFDPGVYTFRAKYDGDEFLKGMAILRLNVFPRLSVLPDNSDKLADDERTAAPELTLVHPDEEGGESATIKLPSIEELEDAYKYSTIKIASVEIKHGDEVTNYTAEEYEALEDKNFKFEEDGYVKYIIRYADTEDFQIESTVNVVLMPQVPAASDISDDNKVTLTASKNAKLQYAYYPTPAKKNAPAKRLANASADELEWTTVPEGNTTELDLNEAPEGTKSIFYRSQKDISAYAADGDLNSEMGEIVLDATVDYYLVGEMTTNDRCVDGKNNPSFRFTPTDVEGVYSLEVSVIKQGQGFTIQDTDGNVFSINEQDMHAGIESGSNLYSYTLNERSEVEYQMAFVSTYVNVTFTFDTGNNNLTIDGTLDELGSWVINYGNDKTMQSGELVGGVHVVTTQSKDDGKYVAMLYVYAPQAAKEVYYEIIPTTDTQTLAETPEGNYKKVTQNADGSYHISVSQGTGDLNLYYVDKDGVPSSVYSTKYEVKYGIPTAVDGIEAEDGEAVYYDLNGFKVDAERLDHGIYIKVTGKKVEKIIL